MTLVKKCQKSNVDLTPNFQAGDLVCYNGCGGFNYTLAVSDTVALSAGCGGAVYTVSRWLEAGMRGGLEAGKARTWEDEKFGEFEAGKKDLFIEITSYLYMIYGIARLNI